MTARADVHPVTHFDTRTARVSKLYQEGIVAGVAGAATIAVWFLILDSIAGRPFYTPTVLGTALFRKGAGLDSPQSLPVSFDMVLAFTWLHLLVFAVIGGLASQLIGFAERRPNFGFAVILFFVIFEFGFVTVFMTFAQDVLHALAWPRVLVGNLLAATSMGVYFWRRHPQLTIEP